MGKKGEGAFADHVFVLKETIEMYRKKKKGLFVGFMDVEKA